MKIRARVMTIVFVLIVATIAIVNAAMPKKDFSENENRVLAEFPELTWESLFDGTPTVDETGRETKQIWTTDFETYISDHFMFRDQWVGLKSLVELGAQKKDSGGVYFAKDGYLIEQFWSYDNGRFQGNLTAAKEFSQKVQDRFGIEVKAMIVPTANDILKDKLPLFAPEVDQQELIAQMKEALPGFIDVTDVLSAHKDEDIFYKTDHHWTSLGVYYAYQEFCKEMGIEPKPLSWYQSEVLSDQFLGTTYSKANLYTVQPETIMYYKNPNEYPLEVEYRAGDKVTETSNSLIEEKYLNEKDKYSAFLNGNQAITKITTSNKNGKKLLIVKDSYANSFAPFAVNDYEEVHMIDLRAYRQSTMDYMEQNGITDVLLLYNVQNFTEDSNVYQLTK